MNFAQEGRHVGDPQPELFGMLKFHQGKDGTTISFIPLLRVVNKLQDPRGNPHQTVITGDPLQQRQVTKQL